MFLLSKNHPLSLEDFYSLLHGEKPLGICPSAEVNLNETRNFIDYLLKEHVQAYGITTGFADLRNTPVPPDKAAELSRNIIASHDAGIGPSFPPEVTLGAMIIRANSLAKGYSGFQTKSLQTLVDMINARIIPEIPCSGSLGASGDLAPLARLARAMQGEDVPVFFKQQKTSAKKALQEANISPFSPLAKEGLAMTNGTSFMSSMAAIAVAKELHLLENVLALLPLFLESIGAVDSAFSSSIQEVRKQNGQKFVSAILQECLKSSPFIDTSGVQDDYCVRCIPQILGPKIEVFLEHIARVEKELDAVTDNPLIFRNNEIDETLDKERILQFNQETWAVLSGGNFHGEYLTTIADSIASLNAKIVLLLERQLTYMLNPFRNKQKLPIYLIADSTSAGLSSGYMITQYTANDLTQKIAAYGVPTGIFNITSANESEDVVSYGSTACQRLLAQIALMEDFLAIYQTTVIQAYSLAREHALVKKDTYSEKLFSLLLKSTSISYPYKEESSFTERYNESKKILSTALLRKHLGHPLLKFIKDHEIKHPAFCGPVCTSGIFSVH